MRIGILQAGKVNEALVSKYGEYPPMFEVLLGPAAPEFSYAYYATVEGELPGDPTECDAWLITGSKYGVYDDQPWIAPLKAFLRDARAASRPIVGICFGHQVVAEAFGGRAEKSSKGWGVGVQEYEVHHRPSWMADAPERISFHAIHQDQVTALPEDATVLASSPFCDHAFVTYGDPEAPEAIAIQPHPEFELEFARDLMEILAGSRVPAEFADPALESYGRPVHSDAFARWCANYLRLAGRRAAAA